jgi:hypothetical protein
MTRRNQTEPEPRNAKRPGDARREEMMSLIARIDAVLSEVEQSLAEPAEAH